MIGEAVDTLITLGWALAVWIVLMALTATVVLYTALTTVLVPPCAAWRAVVAALAAERALQAWQAHPDRYRPRQHPSWVRPTDPREIAVSRTHSERQTA